MAAKPEKILIWISAFAGMTIKGSLFKEDARPDRTIAGCAPFDLARDHVALELRDMVDEQHAVQMVDFVLDALAQQILGFQLLFFALLIEIGQADALRPRDIGILVGDRQAAFVIGESRFRIAPDDFRDSPSAEPCCRCAPRNIDRDHAFERAHLIGGKADAVALVHRLHHVFHEFGDALIDRADGLRILAQNRIGNDADRDLGHAASLSADAPLDIQ